MSSRTRRSELSSPCGTITRIERIVDEGADARARRQATDPGGAPVLRRTSDIGAQLVGAAACRSPAVWDQAKGRRAASDPNLKLEAPHGTDSSQAPRWRKPDSNLRSPPRKDGLSPR
jgi:hypothetical protein